jgi:hypothetical protein
MDSGHLSYHLESLGDLITRSPDGKYGLSSFGLAAVRLMSGVEEHDSSAPTPKRRNIVSLTAAIFSVVLVIALLATSVYTLGLTTQTYGDRASVGPILVGIAPNETFSYDVTLVYGSGSVIGEPYGISIGIPDTQNTIAEWTEYTLAFEVETNSSYDVSLAVHDPDGRIISPVSSREAGGLTGFPYWFGMEPHFTKPGTYKIQIENEKTDWFHANMTLNVAYVLSQRPLFACALAGFIVVLLYPTALLLSWFWLKKSKPTASAPRTTFDKV